MTRRGVVAGVIVVLAIGACRQVVGIGDQPPGESAAPICGGLPWSASDCLSCMQSSCCEEATKCAGEAACASQFGCVAKCGGDEACRSRCITHGDVTMATLGACQSHKCSGACGLTCGGWGLLPGQQMQHIESSPGCVSCLTSSACQQLASCVGNASCLASRFCGNACTPADNQCRINCGYPALDLGSPNALDAGAVISNQGLLAFCASSCSPGSDWSCLGHVSWPTPTTTTITARVRLVDPLSYAPLQGVTAYACQIDDPTCQSPVAKGVSGADGVVAVKGIPVQISPFTGYFLATVTGYLPSLFFVTPFMAEDNGSTPAQIGTSTMPTEKVMRELYSLASVPFDPSLGTIGIYPIDCEGVGATGVSFTGTSLGDAAVPFYWIGGKPTTQAQGTSNQNPIPTGGLANVNPGAVTVSGHIGSTVFATASVFVPEGGVTQLILVPQSQ